MRNHLSIIFVLGYLAASAVGGEVELTVTEPVGVVRQGWPVTSGIPLAEGELRRAAEVALYSAAGDEIPLQTEVLSRWRDGTIRWLLLDFQLDLAAGQARKLVLRYGPEVGRSEPKLPRLVHTRGSHAYPITPVLQTGPLKVQISTDQFRLLDAIWLDRNHDGKFAESERLTTGGSTGLVLVATDGTRHRADLSLATWTVEQHGPLRACVRIDGQHRSEDGLPMFSYVVRLHAFRGHPFVKFEYTFVNDYPDALMAQIDAIEFVCSTGDGDQFVLNGQPTAEPSRLFQVDDQQFEINGRASTGRAPGWAAIGSSAGGMAVGVQEFWQNWPKSLEVKPGELRVGICPEFPQGQYDGRPLLEEVKHCYYLRDGVYTFKVGVARTHELWATFFDGAPESGPLAQFFRAAEIPLLAQCSPEYVCRTGVLGDAPPAAPEKYHGYDAWLDVLFENHLQQQQSVREYGMLNFGDWYNEKKFGGGWANQEYDTAHSFFVQYLRSGDRRYFDRARQGARHFMDVDVLHAINHHIRGLDHHRQPQPGHIWTHCVGHTGGYYDGAELRAPLWVQRGMLHDNGHVWIGGAVDCYTLTGNRRAWDITRLVADRVANECPIEYSDHIRDNGWPLNLVMTAYELTGDDRYLAAATRQWKTLHENLDPVQGWMGPLAYGHCSAEPLSERCHGQVSYLLALTLSALSRYHAATDDPEVLAGISTGLDQIIRQCWNEEHKTFYGSPCTHSRNSPPQAYCPTTFLSSLAFAYEINATGNAEHRRIFQAAFETAIQGGWDLLETAPMQAQAGYLSRSFHFTPYGLRCLEE